MQDFLEAAESLLASNPGAPAALSSRPTTSRHAARQPAKNYDLHKGAVELRKRVDKHFVEKHVGHAEDERGARALCAMVWGECGRGYERVLERWERLVGECYPSVEGEKDVGSPFTREQIAAEFKRS